MSEEYILNTIAAILNGKPQDTEPRCVRWRELMASVEADIKVIVGNLHEQGRIVGRRTVNKEPLLFIPNPG